MAQEMRELAKPFVEPDQGAYASSRLPSYRDLRLALNVAACDGAPLVVRVRKKGTASAPARTLAQLAWSPRFVGRVQFVEASPEELEAIEGIEGKADLLFVQSSTYGQSGRCLGTAKVGDSATELAEFLEQGLAAFEPTGERNDRSHVRQGQRQGLIWKTVLPITDPGGPGSSRRNKPGRKDR